MTQPQFLILLIVYLLSISFILTVAYREFRRVRFNFNVFFTILYLLTFYFGFPFTCLLYFVFDVPVVSYENLLYALLLSTGFYGLYFLSYKTRFFPSQSPSSTLASTDSRTEMSRVETHLTWLIMAAIAILSVGVFFAQNGLLLFKLEAYNEIFGSNVSGVALKRFFYFFIPAMLVVYFLQPTWRMWGFFLLSTVMFGLLTYVVVGGTRANIIIAFSLFLFIGITRRWITLWMLLLAGVVGVVGMFWLALKRYGMNVNGMEAFYTFLYLTRDTFSPWENLALLIQNYDQIDFQGLAPIVRDFYVFIPSWVWPDRPNIVLNTANYFTWEVLDYHTGLAISPTLLGSLLVMGGVGMVPIGAVVVGWIIKWFDRLYEKGKHETNPYRGAILQAFCFGAIFYMIVLVREGVDSFVSRVVFFCLIFGFSLLIAKLIFWLMEVSRLIRDRVQQSGLNKTGR